MGNAPARRVKDITAKGVTTMHRSLDDFMGTIYRRIDKIAEAESETNCPPANMYRMAHATCSARVTGRCGETMELYLLIEEERIIEASFFTDGCVNSVRCGAAAARLAWGLSPDGASQIEGDTILRVFPSIPHDDTHCAYLAAEALHAAIHAWMVQSIAGSPEMR